MKTLFKVSLLIMSLVLINCDNSGVEPNEDIIDGNISLSMGVPASLNRVSKSSRAATVSEVRLLLEEIKLKSDGGDSADFKIGPVVVILNLSGGITEIGVASIPAGSYDKFEFKVKKVDTDDVDAGDTQFADFLGTENSVIIKGTYNSNPFTLRIEEEFEQEIEFMIPVNVLSDTSLSNLTLLVDAQSWFTDLDTGIELDPTDSENLSRIIENMDRSFKVYEDDDEDGEMEFEGIVESVETENSSFTLASTNISVNTDANTAFNGTIMSLDSIQVLLSSGSEVKVDGSGSQGTGLRILASEVEFEIES